MLVLCLLLFSIAAFGQTGPAQVAEGGVSNLPAQKIGPNDLLAISVYNAPELTRTVRVSAEGAIRLPMLKEQIKADGRMPAELEQSISDALVSEEILTDPIVTVTVAEYSSRPISVAGAVRQPLTFQAYGNVTLLEAITRAQGLAPEAGPEIIVTRLEPQPNGASKLFEKRIRVKALLDDSDPALNLPLQGGEEIRVPEAGKVFVVGNVKKPGAFQMQDESGMTVLKALAMAEGLEQYASNQAYVYHRAKDGSQTETRVELRKIMDRKAPDAPLGPNDIFYVPDNRGRRLTMATIDKLIGFGVGTVSGILILSNQ